MQHQRLTEQGHARSCWEYPHFQMIVRCRIGIWRSAACYPLGYDASVSFCLEGNALTSIYVVEAG